MSQSTTSDLVSTIATQLNIVIVALRLLVDMIQNPDAASTLDMTPEPERKEVGRRSQEGRERAKEEQSVGVEKRGRHRREEEKGQVRRRGERWRGGGRKQGRRGGQGEYAAQLMM